MSIDFELSGSSDSFLKDQVKCLESNRVRGWSRSEIKMTMAILGIRLESIMSHCSVDFWEWLVLDKG